tara:strand:+ start:1510 stop:2286 length:777 start_codon:yes stop_codon:yes gene_type:complete
MDKLQNMRDNLMHDCHGYEEEVRKTHTGTLTKFHTAEGQREFVATISTNQVDRDGDVIDPRGIDIKNFQANPVIMLNHESWELPIGQALWVRRFTENGKSGLLAKGKITDKTERAREAFGLMQDGVLTQTSIGFGIRPGGAREPNDEELKRFPGVKRMIVKSELFEFSVVGIPANTDAVVQQVSKMSSVPDWLGVEPAAVDLAPVAKDVDIMDPLCILEPVYVEEPLEINRVLTEEEIRKQAEKEATEIYEVNVLGKV